MDVGLTQADPEWKLARYDCVTGTDVGTILGVGRESKKKLMETKIRRREPFHDDRTRIYLTLGKNFEMCARETFRNLLPEYGRGFVPSMHTHPELNWISGTPDYLLPEDKIVVEFKTHFYPSILEASPYESVTSIPLRYYLQVQTYMEILNWDKGILFSWTTRNGYSLFHIRRDCGLWNDVVLPRLMAFHLAMLHWRKVFGTSADMDWGAVVGSCLNFVKGEKAQLETVLMNSMEKFVYKDSFE